MKIPSKITVSSIVSSRYEALDSAERSAVRPASWDARHSGTGVVQTTTGEKIILQSDGQQSTPGIGWVLMLTGGDSQKGYLWTLYALPKGSEQAHQIAA